MSETFLSGQTGVLAAGDAGISQSAVSWGAVFAGGVTAAAIATILSILGAGFGFAAVSPWPGAGLSATGFTVLAAIWLIVVQWVAAFFGGYLAGRLRTKWVAVHSDEVFFRDTAHGFLSWALSTLIVAAGLALAAGGAVKTGTQAATSLANSGVSNHYYVDLLFRQNPGGVTPTTGISAPGVTDQQLHEEATAILAQGIVNGTVPASDQSYLALLVSEKTGLAPTDAQTRVTQVLNVEQADIVKAKQIADASRKAASGAAIYSFVALLIGAFIASVAGAIGGRLRDQY